MRRRRPPQAGAALLDYLGIVLAVGVLMLALVAVREHTPQRRPPIDPVGHIGALVRPPPVVRPQRTTPVRPRTKTPRPRRSRPAQPPRPKVLAPTWAVGW